MDREVHGTGSGVSIRLAGTGDAPRIADLGDQLGYPVSPEEIGHRLQAIQRVGQHAVYVAAGLNGTVVGWVHVYVGLSLLVERQAELGGLVIDEIYRGRGLGRQLVEQAELWARAQGCAVLCVRSNVVREGAHAFYERLGYCRVKVQGVFHKLL